MYISSSTGTRRVCVLLTIPDTDAYSNEEARVERSSYVVPGSAEWCYTYEYAQTLRSQTMLRLPEVMAYLGHSVPLPTYEYRCTRYIPLCTEGVTASISSNIRYHTRYSSTSRTWSGVSSSDALPFFLCMYPLDVPEEALRKASTCRRREVDAIVDGPSTLLHYCCAWVAPGLVSTAAAADETQEGKPIARRNQQVRSRQVITRKHQRATHANRSRGWALVKQGAKRMQAQQRRWSTTTKKAQIMGRAT